MPSTDEKQTASGLARFLPERYQNLFPGVLLATLVALAAQFLSEHYGAPAMLLALLLGIPLHFLAEEGRCVAGIQFCVSFILRLGVALLGVRISIELLSGISLSYVILVLAGVIATIIFGLAGAKILGRGWRFGLLTGGAVAICGASAAIAISAVLPRNEHSDRNLIFTILSVTVLSTIAMIVYPPIAQTLGSSELEIGVFLGGTIHDVAQVVGAGFSASPETGEIATVVKLMRVAMLAPVVLALSIFVRYKFANAEISGKRPPLIPAFVIGFVVLAAINSSGAIPEPVGEFVKDISGWALLIAIAAVGMKTNLKSILDVGGQAIALIVTETVFLALLIAGAIFYLQ